jgi:hypothetical protein
MPTRREYADTFFMNRIALLAPGLLIVDTICTQSIIMLLPTCLIREGACSCMRGP